MYPILFRGPMLRLRFCRLQHRGLLVLSSLLAVFAGAVCVPPTVGQEPGPGPDQSAALALPAQDQDEPEVEQPQNIDQVGQDKVRFNFKDGNWEAVIRWLAQQGGYTLQEPEVFPPQSFVYSDDKDYTILEAIDLVNRHLSLRGYTLVRNNKLMYLVEKDVLRDDNWRQIIEVIPEEELLNRGAFEVIKVRFDLSEMNLEDLNVRELESMVSRDHDDEFVYSEQGKFIIAREVGYVLRDMKQLLDRVRNYGIDTGEMMVIPIEYSTVEDVMPIVRGLLKLDDQNQPIQDNMQLTIFIDSFARKVYARGDKRDLELLQRTIQSVDNDQKSGEVATELLRFEKYPVSGNAEEVFKVVASLVQRRFGTSGIMLDYLPEQNILLAETNEEKHEFIKRILASVDAPTQSVVAIQLENITTTSMISDLREFYPESTEEESEGTKVVFLEDDVNDRIIVSGPPADLARIQKIVDTIDIPLILDDGPRKNSRIISMSEFQAEQVLDSIVDIWDTTGRPNRILPVFPEDRARRGNSFIRGLDRPEPEQPKLTPQQQEAEDFLPPPVEGGNRGDSRSRSRDDDTSLDNDTSFQFRNNAIPTSFTNWQQVSQDIEAQDDDEQEINIPGSDIRVKITSLGVMISSNDLDALDELEYLIRDNFGDSSVGYEEVEFFLLKHRDPIQVKAQLTNLIEGPQESSGGRCQSSDEHGWRCHAECHGFQPAGYSGR